MKNEKRRIYFLNYEGGNAIKLGLSEYVDARLSMLAAWTPHKLTLVTHAPGNRFDELAIMLACAEHRIRGEWFRPNQTLQSIIEHVAQYGALPQEIGKHGRSLRAKLRHGHKVFAPLRSLHWTRRRKMDRDNASAAQP